MSVLPFQNARHIVEEHAARVHSSGGAGAQPRAAEVVPLLSAVGRVLAEEVRASRDLPPFRRATRDGYAVRAADLARVPVPLRVVAQIRAGADAKSAAAQVGLGEAVEIMTGAPVPEGADAVVMVEHTRPDSDRVIFERSAREGENIVPVGAEAQRGAAVLPAGVRLDAARIAAAASVGCQQLRVWQRPRVAILSTGDEVVDIGTTPGDFQIANSNSYALSVQVQEAGGLPVRLPIAPDDRTALCKLLAQGIECDLLVITGGVSVGRYDLVEEVLSTMGAQFFFTGALIQPGRPVVFGEAPRSKSESRTYFLGLPGNPVSTMVTFELFARPLIRVLAGMPTQPLRFLQAHLAAPIRVKPGLTRFLPAHLDGEFAETTVTAVPWQGSGDIFSVARADAWLVIPPDRDELAAGELVSVLPRSS